MKSATHVGRPPAGAEVSAAAGGLRGRRRAAPEVARASRRHLTAALPPAPASTRAPRAARRACARNCAPAAIGDGPRAAGTRQKMGVGGLHQIIAPSCARGGRRARRRRLKAALGVKRR
jgi:hypothetical protein